MLRPSKLVRLCPLLLLLFSSALFLFPNDEADQLLRRFTAKGLNITRFGSASICSKVNAVRKPRQTETIRLWQNFLSHSQEYSPVPVKSFGEYDISTSGWSKVSKLPNSSEETAFAQTRYQAFRNYIAPCLQWAGQGIVMFATESSAEHAATSLRILRILGNMLPVELWFVDEHLTAQRWCDELSEQGVGCRFLSSFHANMSLPRLMRSTDQQKIAALLFSAFEDILYMDSSVVPISTLDNIFDVKAYLETGLVLWPGLGAPSRTKWADIILGLNDESYEASNEGRIIDAAQFLISKRRHWKTLVLFAYHVFHAEFFYPLLSSSLPSELGFSASLHAAAQAVGSSFHLLELGPEPMSKGLNGSGHNKETGIAILHHRPGQTKSITPIHIVSRNNDDDGSNSLTSVKEQQILFMHTINVHFGVRSLMCDRQCLPFPLPVTSASTAPGSEAAAPVWPMISDEAGFGGRISAILSSMLALLPDVDDSHTEAAPSGAPMSSSPSDSVISSNIAVSSSISIPSGMPSSPPQGAGYNERNMTFAAVESPSHPLYAALKSGDAVLSQKQLEGWGLNGFEELLWSAMGSLVCERDATDEEKVLAKNLDEARRVASFRAMRAMFPNGGLALAMESDTASKKRKHLEQSTWRDEAACLNLKEYGRKRFGDQWRWEARGSMYQALSCKVN